MVQFFTLIVIDPQCMVYFGAFSSFIIEHKACLDGLGVGVRRK